MPYISFAVLAMAFIVVAYRGRTGRRFSAFVGLHYVLMAFSETRDNLRSNISSAPIGSVLISATVLYDSHLTVKKT